MQFSMSHCRFLLFGRQTIPLPRAANQESSRRRELHARHINLKILSLVFVIIVLILIIHATIMEDHGAIAAIVPRRQT